MSIPGPETQEKEIGYTFSPGPLKPPEPSQISPPESSQTDTEKEDLEAYLEKQRTFTKALDHKKKQAIIDSLMELYSDPKNIIDDYKPEKTPYGITLKRLDSPDSKDKVDITVNDKGGVFICGAPPEAVDKAAAAYGRSHPNADLHIGCTDTAENHVRRYCEAGGPRSCITGINDGREWSKAEVNALLDKYYGSEKKMGAKLG